MTNKPAPTLISSTGPSAPLQWARAQIDRLSEACSLPHIRLQIMPFTAGPHSGAYGPFQIFRGR